MGYTYDSEADALYVTLSDGPFHRTVEMTDGVYVDVDDRGRAIGVEVLRPGAPWDAEAVIARFELGTDDAETLRWHRQNKFRAFSGTET